MSTIFWLVEIISTFIECSLCLMFNDTFIDKTEYKNTLPKSIILSAISTVVMYQLNKIELYSSLTVVFAIALICVMSAIIFYKNIIKVSVLSIIYFFIVIMTDNIWGSIISYMAEISTSTIYQELSHYRMIAIVASKTMLMITIVMINKLFSKKATIKRKYLIFLFLITVALMMITVSMSFIEMNENSTDSLLPILFFAIALALLLIVFFGVFKFAAFYENRQELKLVQMRNEMLEQSIKETKETFELMRTSIHDYKHDIINLSTMAKNKDLDGIADYLDKKNNLLNKRLFYYQTGNETVDAILYIKQKIAENHGIPFMITAYIPERCPVSSEHFASILGNLLDNAIKASQYGDGTYIEVKLSELENLFWIIVKNKYFANESKSDKPDKLLHGIGLNSVKHTVNEYNGETFILDENNFFEVRIMIPMSEK